MSKVLIKILNNQHITSIHIKAKILEITNGWFLEPNNFIEIFFAPLHLFKRCDMLGTKAW
jgi:hypothetical protein